MKFVVDRAALLPALDRAKGATAGRGGDICGYFVIAAQGRDSISVTACDGDLQITVMAIGDVAARGTVATPAALVDIVKKLPAGCQLEIELDVKGGNRLVVRAARSRFVLPTLPAGDLPILKITGGVELATEAALLHGLLSAVAVAQSTDATARPFLCGIHLHYFAAGVSGPELRAAATNGHMLARRSIAAPANAAAMPGVILPRRGVAELLRLLDGAAGPVTLWVTDTLVRLEAGDVTLISKLIDGTFPEYERVIPGGDGLAPLQAATMGRAALLAAVELVATIGEDKKGRAVSLAVARSGLTLSSRGAGGEGDARDEIDAEWAGSPLEVGFNVKYLTLILSRMAGARVSMDLTDAAAPAILRNPDDPAGLYVCMPMRI